MNTTRLPFDPCCVDADGLPHLGTGDHLFLSSFEVLHESVRVQGIVAAKDSRTAASLLLNAEAHLRFTTYAKMLPVARNAVSRQITRAEAMEHRQSALHRVSCSKSACANRCTGTVKARGCRRLAALQANAQASPVLAA